MTPDTLRDYTIGHQIDGVTVDCGRCGQEVIGPLYTLTVITVVQACRLHSERCTG